MSFTLSWPIPIASALIADSDTLYPGDALHLQSWRGTNMIHRLCILCFLVALSPGFALAQSAALMDAYNRYKALDAQGRYAEAEPFARKALELSRKEFGPDHPHTGALLNNLALLYQAQGRYAEAEPFQKSALAIMEKALGPEHPHVATSLINLAGLYWVQGRYGEAEPLFRRSLAIDEKALGPEHPKVATSLENYANLLRKTGRTSEADKMEARAKAIRDKRAKENK